MFYDDFFSATDKKRFFRALSIAGMSNSNHYAGRTLSFKARKAYSGPQFEKIMSILDML